MLRILFVLLFAFPAVSAFTQQSLLPAAPSSNSTATEQGKWAGVIEPGERTQLTAKDKLMFPIHEELTPSSWFPTFAGAGLGQLVNSHPDYGTDSGAFGQRLGAAAIRDLSMRTFSDGVLPALFHQDPRYLRMHDGPKAQRGLYAVSRVLVARSDSGASEFNSSVLLGHGMASALTMAYYPDKSAKASVVFETLGLSLLGEAGSNLWSEFWPDVRERVFHRHHNSQH